VLLSKRSKDRIDAKICALTPRNWGSSIVQCIKGINSYINGWVQFFSICTNGVGRVLKIFGWSHSATNASDPTASNGNERAQSRRN
jgi:Group II intron, maturase-specific domain